MRSTLGVDHNTNAYINRFLTSLEGKNWDRDKMAVNKESLSLSLTHTQEKKEKAWLFEPGWLK